MDTTGDAMDWRVDTPPRVFYKRPRDETEDDENRLRLERATPNHSALALTQQPIPQPGFGNPNRFAPAGVEPAPNQPAPQPELSNPNSSWLQFLTGSVILVTYVSTRIAKSLGIRTFKAGRFVIERRNHAAAAVTDTVTAFKVGATGAKRRIVQFYRDHRPQPPRRRSPPRIRPHPHNTSTTIRLENEERARREALEAAAMDVTESGHDFEPTMSGALPVPDDFQPSIAPTMQTPSNMQPNGFSVSQNSTDFHLAMPGAMPDDTLPTSSVEQTMFVAASSDNDGADQTMGDTNLATATEELVNHPISEPWPTSILDSPYSSDSEMPDSVSDVDEVMCEDDNVESPITNDTDHEAGKWVAADELQRLYDVDYELEMDLNSPVNLFSEPEGPKSPQSVASGSIDVHMFSPVMRKPLPYPPVTPISISYIMPQEPDSSLLSDVPLDFDSSPPAMTSVKRSPQKSVAFFHSPKTGKPVDRVKRYYVDEPMDDLVSSSPRENSEGSSISSSVDSDESVYDYNPVLIEAAKAHGRRNDQRLTPTTITNRSSPPVATANNTLIGNPDPAGPIHVTNVVPITIDENGDEVVGYAGVRSADASFISSGSPKMGSEDSEIAGYIGDMPIDASLITNGSMGSANSGIDGAVGSMPAVASLLAHGPILAPIQNIQYQTRRRPSTYTITATELGSPIKKRTRSPPISARSLSKVSPESMIMQENVVPPRGLINTSLTAPVAHMSSANKAEHAAPAERLVESSKGDNPISQGSDFWEQVIAAEGSTTPGPQNTRSDQSTPASDLSTQLGSLKVSDRRHSVRRIQQEQEEQKLREREKQRVAEEKARKEKEEAEAAAEKARLEKAKAEEEARVAKEAEEERRRNIVREIPVEDVIQPLSDEWEAKVEAAMAQERNKVLAETSTGTTLTRKDFGTLFPQAGRDPASGWLNDEVIMAYLQAIVNHGREVAGNKADAIPKYHAFNTFFFKNIRDKGVQSVKRWATKAKIGGQNLKSVERVFIPVHSGAHWTLLVVSPIAQTIEYFDSMDGRTGPFVKAAQDWLKQEMGRHYKEEEWRVLLPEGGGPQQNNGSDCGVFTVTTAKMVMLGIEPMAYSSLDIPLQRKRMVAELMNGGFTADFAPNFTFEKAEDEDEA